MGMGKLNNTAAPQQKSKSNHNKIRTDKKIKGAPPKKKSVQAADKSVRTKIANGELVKVIIHVVLVLSLSTIS